MANKNITIEKAEQPYITVTPKYNGEAEVKLDFCRTKRDGSYDFYTIEFKLDSDELSCLGRTAIKGVDAIGRQMWAKRNANVKRIQEAV